MPDQGVRRRSSDFFKKLTQLLYNISAGVRKWARLTPSQPWSVICDNRGNTSNPWNNLFSDEATVSHARVEHDRYVAITVDLSVKRITTHVDHVTRWRKVCTIFVAKIRLIGKADRDHG